MKNERSDFMDKNKIPYGAYCYGRNDKCPYWELIETKLLYENPKDDCDYYNKCTDNDKCGTSLKTKCYINVIRCNYLNLLDDKEDTLLWDQVKECDINLPDDDQ